MQQPTATPSKLEQAAEAVRRHKAELDNSTATYNFHTKMAATAFDEVKKHQRNLDQAKNNLSTVASQTGAGASVTVPKPIKQSAIQGA